MIPIGVFGHPDPSPPVSPSRRLFHTHTFKNTEVGKSRAPLRFSLRRAKGPSSFTSPTRQDSLTTQGAPSTPATKLKKHPPAVYIPAVDAGRKHLASLQVSPAESEHSSQAGVECPSLPRFSWQSRNTSPEHLRVRARHVEIVIPNWACPPDLITPPPSPEPLSGHLRDFPIPPSENPAEQSFGKDRSHFKISKKSRIKRHSLSEIKRLEARCAKAPELRNARKMDNSNSSPSAVGGTAQDQSSIGSRPDTATSQPSNPDSFQISTPLTSASGSANNLSSLVCNVHRSTGEKPPALVGASTTISGDKLFVFGGRRLSRRKSQLTQELFELDLISRHWTKLVTRGSLPPPRYFHSCCALGDKKLVCYGGMAPMSRPPHTGPDGSHADSQQAEPGIVVMSDVHIFDIATKTWSAINAANPPAGRYAHCASILPSSAFFTSESAKSTAVANATSSTSLDQAKGGAEMIIVGGQDGSSQYIEQISIFNLRSLQWVSTVDLGKSCGAYRSVVTPITTLRASQIGARTSQKPGRGPVSEDQTEDDATLEDGYPSLIYSNYNFLDVKLELQIRHPSGSLEERQMRGPHSPPGLRFPNGEVIGPYFVVSGTFLTSSKQEYALWALDLRSLTWSRIDTGSSILSSGSWNRGVLWKKRNSFVILGDRRRSLSEDYNHRRLNFSNVCVVELEAFGLYDNPVTSLPVGFPSASSATKDPLFTTRGIPPLTSPAASSLGQSVSQLKETADMDLVSINGERIPVNSHVIIRRWGLYLMNLLEKTFTPHEGGNPTTSGRPGAISQASRNSSVTITPGSVHSFTNTLSDALDNITNTRTASPAVTLGSANSDLAETLQNFTLTPDSRSRLLYLPHTRLTLQALAYYLYTWSLPAPGHRLCSLQILCSLLQLARPYRVDGLLEATVERLHQVLDGRNTAAIFNAAAMAAGGGEGFAFVGDAIEERRRTARPAASQTPIPASLGTNATASDSAPPEDSEDEAHSNVSSSTTSLSGNESPGKGHGSADQIWAGDLSSVVGLQKRGLRGLMEGRRMRERGTTESSSGVSGTNAEPSGVGLGIG